MPARSGAEYVESIKKHAPCVYLGGRRIADVTAEPLFVEPIRAIAEQYDMQCDAAYREVMGRNFPTMSVMQVVALIEDAAKVEIEATAVLPRQ